jgi:predicted dehydrogenase
MNLTGQPTQAQTFEMHNALQFQLEAFAKAIQHKMPYLISPQDILRTVKVFEATAKSIDTQQKITL